MPYSTRQRLDEILIALKQRDGFSELLLPEVADSHHSDLLWIKPKGETHCEYETIGHEFTGWYRKVKDYDKEEGWWLEEKSITKEKRWSNFYSREIIHEDPYEVGMTYLSVVAICKKNICRIKQVENHTQLPHFPWAVLIHSFAVGCLHANVRNFDLLDLFKKLIQDSMTPVPIFFDDLPREVLLADAKYNLPLGSVRNNADNADLAAMLKEYYSNIVPKNGLHEIFLLSRLSDPALTLLAKKMGVESFWSGQAQNRISLIRDITNNILGVNTY